MFDHFVGLALKGLTFFVQLRGVRKAKSNIYNGAFSLKWLTAIKAQQEFKGNNRIAVPILRLSLQTLHDSCWFCGFLNFSYITVSVYLD